MYQVYQDGIRNLNLYYILRHLAVPVITCLLLAITLPYFVAAGAVPVFGKHFKQQTVNWGRGWGGN